MKNLKLKSHLIQLGGCNPYQKITQMMIIKLLVITTILLCTFFTANADHGVVEIVMRAASQSSTNVEQIKIKTEKQTMLSVVLVNQTGETITRTVFLTNQQQRVEFNISFGTYQVFVIDIETGHLQKYTIKLH